MELIILYLTYAICAIAFIGALASIYFINYIWAYRKHKFIQSRSPTLTYSVLWIFFGLLLLAIANSLLRNSVHVDFWGPTLFFVVSDAVQYGCTFAYATRAWILFYHVQWSYESVNRVWRTQLTEIKENVGVEADIDSVQVADDSDASLFWIKHRNSLGNWKKVFPVTMGLLFPLSFFLSDILPFIAIGIDKLEKHEKRIELLTFRGVNMLYYLVIFMLIAILVRRIHKISDKYGIGQELQRINICFAVFIVINRMVTMTLFIFLTDDAMEMQLTLMTFVEGLCNILAALCALYIASFFVLRKLFREYDIETNTKTLQIFNSGSPGLPTMENVGTYTGSTCNEERVTLNSVLSTQYGFETFTQFLISELSVENILFCVEVKQYKACCRRYHDAENTPPSIDQRPTLSWTTTSRSKPEVFRSTTIMSLDYVPSNSVLRSLEPYDYATYLYHKYVSNDSDLQINLPSKTHKTLTKFLIQTEKSEVVILAGYTETMFELYDAAWQKIHTLMQSDSYSRFRETPEFNDVCKKMKAKISMSL